MALFCTLTYLGMITLVGCPDLQTLIVGPNRNIGDTAVQAVASACRKLTKFHLDGSRVSGKGVETLSRNCLSLEDLRLSDGSMLSNAALRHLHRLPLLRKVNISACGKRVTDTGISDLVCGRPDTIEELDLSGLCLTSAAVENVAQNCKKLQMLRIHADWCTQSALNALQRNCPLLTDLCVINTMSLPTTAPVATDGDVTPAPARRPQPPARPTKNAAAPSITRFNMTIDQPHDIHERIEAQRRFNADTEAQKEHLMMCLLEDENKGSHFPSVS